MLRRLSLSAAVVAGSVLFMLILFEVGLRVANGISPLRLTNFIREGADPMRTQAQAIYDEILGWRPKLVIAITQYDQ
jgi:hypothetical protein